MLRIHENDPDLDTSTFDGELYLYKGRSFTGMVFCTDREGRLTDEEQYVNGYAKGLQRSYYKNGTLKEESFKKNDLMYGKIREWDENGSLIREDDLGPERKIF